MPKKTEKHTITAGDFKVTSQLFNYLQNVKARPSINTVSQRNSLNIGNREKNFFKMASGMKRAQDNRKKLPSSPNFLLKPKSPITNLKNKSTRITYSRKGGTARSTKSSKIINSPRTNSDQCTSTQAVTFYTSTPLKSVQIACLQNKRLLNSTAGGTGEILGSAGSDGIQKSSADSASIAKTGCGTKFNVTSIKFTGSKVKGRRPSEKPKESVRKTNRSGKPSLMTMKSDMKTYMGRKSSGKLMNSKVITFTDRNSNVVRLKPIKKLSLPYSDPLPGTSSAEIKDQTSFQMLLTDTTRIMKETKDIIKGSTSDNLGKADKRRRNAKLFCVPPIKSKKRTRYTVKKLIRKSLPDQSKASPLCVKKNYTASSKSRKNNKTVKVTSQLEIPVMVPTTNARKPSKISSSKKPGPSVDLTVKKELNLSSVKNKKSPSLKETERTSKEFLPFMKRVTPKRISKKKSTKLLSSSHRVKESKSSSKVMAKNIEKTVLNNIQKSCKKGSKTKHRVVHALPNNKQKKIQSPMIKTCKEPLSKKNRIMSYSSKSTTRSVTKTRNKKTDVLKYKTTVAAFQDSPVIESARVQNHSSQILPIKNSRKAKSYSENKVCLQKNALISSTATGSIRKTDILGNKTAVVAVVDILDTLPKMMKSKSGKLQPKIANLLISSSLNKDLRKSAKRKIKLSNTVKGFPKQPSPTKKRQHATSKSSAGNVPKRLETVIQKSLSFATKRTHLKATGKSCRNLPSVVKINPQILKSLDHFSSKLKNEDDLAVSYNKSSMKKRSTVQNESLELSTQKQRQAQKRVKNQVKRLNNKSQAATITGRNKSQTVAKKAVNQSFSTTAGHEPMMPANRSLQSRKLKSYFHSSKIGPRHAVVRKVSKSAPVSVKQARPIQQKILLVHIRPSLKKLSVPKSPLQSMTSPLYQTKFIPDGRISFMNKTVKARTHAKTGSHIFPGMKKGRNANQVKKEVRKSLIDKKLKPSFSSQRSTPKSPPAKQLRKRAGTDKSNNLLKNDIHISKLKFKTLHKLPSPSPRKKLRMSHSLPSVKNFPQTVNVTSEPVVLKIKTKSSSGSRIAKKESLQIKRKKSARKTTKVPIMRSLQKSASCMTIEPKMFHSRKQPAQKKKHFKKLDAVNTKKSSHAINIGMTSHTFADTINTSRNLLSQKLKYMSFGGQQRLSSFRQGKKERKSTSQGKKSKGLVRRGTSKSSDSKKPNGQRTRINVNDSRHNVRPLQATSLKKYTTGSLKHTTYQKKDSLVSSRKVKALSASKLMETNSYAPPAGKKVIKSISSLLTETNKNYIKDQNAEKRPLQGKSATTNLTVEERLSYRNSPLLSAEIKARNSLTPIAERFQGAAKTEMSHAFLGEIETLVPLFGGRAVTKKKSYMSSKEVKRKSPLSAQKQSAVGKNTEKSDFAYHHKIGNVRGLSKTLSVVPPVLVKYDSDSIQKVVTALQPQKKATTSRVVSIDKTTKSVQKPLYDRKVTEDSPVITRNKVIYRRSGRQTSSPFHTTETYFLKKSVLGPDTTIRVQDNIETDQPVLLSRCSLNTDERDTRSFVSTSRSLDITNRDASGIEKQEVKEMSYVCEESEESGFEEDKSDKGELKISENTILNCSKHSQQCTVS